MATILRHLAFLPSKDKLPKMTKALSKKTTPLLLTERTNMRAPCITDFADSANMWAQERVFRHISGKPSSEADSWSRLLRYIGHWQALAFGYWVVEDKETGDYLGEVGFADYKRGIKHSLIGVPEIGWVLAPHAQGRGLATETVAEALKWGDLNLQCNKTFCIFDPKHSASVRVATKNGYQSQGLVTYIDQPALLMERERSN